MNEQKMYNLQKSCNIDDCKPVETETHRGMISGYLSFAGVVDKANEVITPQALQYAHNYAQERKSHVGLFFEHQYDLLIGDSQLYKTAILEDTGGYRINAYFLKTDMAQEKYEGARNGEYGLSVGASYRTSDITKKYTKGRLEKPLTIYNKIIIKEASLVKNPCNQNAIIDIVKSADVALFANVTNKKEWKDVMREWVFKYMSDSQLNTLFSIIRQNPNIDFIDDVLSFSSNNIDSQDLLEEMINSVKNILTNRIQTIDNDVTETTTAKSETTTLSQPSISDIAEMLQKSGFLKKI